MKSSESPTQSIFKLTQPILNKNVVMLVNKEKDKELITDSNIYQSDQIWIRFYI